LRPGAGNRCPDRCPRAMPRRPCARAARPRRRRCATIPPPWGLLTLGLLVLLPGDALYRALFPALLSAGACPPGPGERLFLRVLGGALIVGWWALVLAEVGVFGAGTVLLGVGAISARSEERRVGKEGR